MRITAFAIGLIAAGASALTMPQARADGGAWALLTNEQVVEVEKKFIDALEAYTEFREGRAEEEKQRRGEVKDNSGLLGDLEKRTRDDIRRNNRRPANPSEEDRIRDNRRKLPGGAGEEAEEILKQRAERRKSLRELLKELNAPEEAPLQKYSKDYAKALVETLKDDPKKFAELAGEISAGDYGKLPKEIGKASADLLKKAVGDVLEAYKGETAKEIWEGFTGGVEDLQDVGSALFRGDWAKFRSSLKELGMKKAKEATEEVIKQTIGFAFGPLGEKAGSAYVKVIEAEVELLKWSKRTLDRSVTTPCLNRYVENYERIAGRAPDTPFNPGAASEAYIEFKMCSEERGKFIGFAALEAYIVQNGLDVNEIYGKLAEDYRLGKVQFVDRWFEDLLEERKQDVEQRWEKEFDEWSGRVGDASRRVNQASSIMINGIIADVLGEAKLSELEAAAAKALLDTFQDMQKLRRAANGAIAACNDFEDAKADAAGNIKAGEETATAAEALEARAKNFAGCNADATALASLKRLYERAQTLDQDFAREVKATEAGVDAACKAAEAVSKMTSEDDARRQLADAKQRTEAAQKSADAAQAAFRELTDLASRAGEVKLGGDQPARDALAELVAEAELLNMGQPALDAGLREAKEQMAAALRTAQNLEGFAIDQANKIKPILAPHRESTLRAQILAVEDEIEGALEGIADCRRSISDDWNNGKDGQPAWRAQRIAMSASSAMMTAVEAAKAKCSAAPGEDPLASQRAIADLAAKADGEATIAGLGKATAERCLAQAGSAFTNVRAAANAVLTAQAPILDDPKYFAAKWTIADGNLTQQGYDGEYIYKGSYTWNPPPANIGPEGFSITMNVSCEVGPKQGGISTGIGISAEGIDIVRSAADRTPLTREEAQAPVTCPTGGGNSASVTVHLMPRASYSEGDVVKMKIGAFWAAGVTYRYVAGQPKP